MTTSTLLNLLMTITIKEEGEEEERGENLKLRLNGIYTNSSLMFQEEKINYYYLFLNFEKIAWPRPKLRPCLIKQFLTL